MLLMHKHKWVSKHCMWMLLLYVQALHNRSMNQLLQILCNWAREINDVLHSKLFCQNNTNRTLLCPFITHLGPTYDNSAQTPCGKQIKEVQRLHVNHTIMALMHGWLWQKTIKITVWNSHQGLWKTDLYSRWKVVNYMWNATARDRKGDPILLESCIYSSNTKQCPERGTGC